MQVRRRSGGARPPCATRRPRGSVSSVGVPPTPPHDATTNRASTRQIQPALPGRAAPSDPPAHTRFGPATANAGPRIFGAGVAAGSACVVTPEPPTRPAPQLLGLHQPDDRACARRASPSSRSARRTRGLAVGAATLRMNDANAPTQRRRSGGPAARISGRPAPGVIPARRHARARAPSPESDSGPSPPASARTSFAVSGEEGRGFFRRSRSMRNCGILAASQPSQLAFVHLL